MPSGVAELFASGTSVANTAQTLTVDLAGTTGAVTVAFAATGGVPAAAQVTVTDADSGEKVLENFNYQATAAGLNAVAVLGVDGGCFFTTAAGGVALNMSRMLRRGLPRRLSVQVNALGAGVQSVLQVYAERT